MARGVAFRVAAALVAAAVGAATAREFESAATISRWAPGGARADACDGGARNRSLFVAHWTHVPKAGGTSFGDVARRVACAMNPRLRSYGGRVLNPCCFESFCATHLSCDATASACPLVAGIGRHESSMARLVDFPCCGREWYLLTARSFIDFSFTAPMADAELRGLGVARDASGEWAESGGSGARESYARRARSYDQWPFEQRARFFGMSGAPYDVIARGIAAGGVYAGEPEKLAALLGIARAFAAAGPAAAGPAETRLASECHRAAHGTWPAAALRHSPYRDGFDAAVARHARPCCPSSTPGSASMAMLREPFKRAASAFFYRAHSPNSDNYRLRPGVFFDATDAGARNRERGSAFTFRDFAVAPEYGNVLAKLFGGSDSCESVRACAGKSRARKRRALGSMGACALLSQCHAYRNATPPFDGARVDRGAAALEAHAFFGLLEAPRASARLALRAFGVAAEEERGVDAERASDARPCGGRRRLALSAVACRGYFKENAEDYALYERAQRLFCARLERAGLLDDAAVAAEIAAADLCGPLDFSREDDVCGRLETARAVDELARTTGECARALDPNWGFPPLT